MPGRHYHDTKAVILSDYIRSNSQVVNPLTPTIAFSSKRQSARMSTITWRLNPFWYRMLYSCTGARIWQLATVGVKGL